MKRHLSVEVTESNRLRKNNLFFFLCLLIFPQFLFSQIERNAQKIFLNGFGRYIFIDNKINLYSLFSYDIDNDGIADVGGLDESGKNLYIYFGKGFNQFYEPLKYSFSLKYDGAVVRKLNLDKRTNLILYSKVDGIIKIYSFNRRNILPLITIKVDCCFNNIDLVNLDRSPELEIVLSGSNFKGIGIISFKGYNYSYKKIEDQPFKKLIPVNLNSDEKIDLVGFNPLSRELILLKNNSLYNYSKSVYKKFDESFDELLSGNFDDDYINDLVLISNETKSIYLLTGNGVGSFSSQIKVKLFSIFSSTINFDYNRDLIDDIIVYDRFDKKLYMKLFSKDYKSLISQPLMEINNFYSMTNYKTTTTKGIAVSSEQGLFLIVYSSLHFNQEKYSLAFSPADLITYRISDELYSRIIFIDRSQKRLNIILRNEFNAPQEILSIPLSYAYERIKILSSNGDEINLVCFKSLAYHFDYFQINLKNGKYFKENLSVDGLIEDIGSEVSTTQKFLLNVLVRVKSEIRTVLLKPFDLNKIVLNEKLISENVIDYSFDFQNRQLLFVNMNSNGEELKLISKKFNQSYKNYDITEIINIKNENYLSIKLFTCDVHSDLQLAFLNLVSLKENNLFVIPFNNPVKYHKLERVRIFDKNSCKCNYTHGTGSKTFSYYNNLSNALERIVFRFPNKPVNVVIKYLPGNTVYSIGYTFKRKQEIIYISNYSIISIEKVEE